MTTAYRMECKLSFVFFLVKTFNHFWYDCGMANKMIPRFPFVFLWTLLFWLFCVFFFFFFGVRGFGFAICCCCVHALSLHVNRAIFFSHRLPPKSTHALCVCLTMTAMRVRQTDEGKNMIWQIESERIRMRLRTRNKWKSVWRDCRERKANNIGQTKEALNTFKDLQRRQSWAEQRSK